MPFSRPLWHVLEDLGIVGVVGRLSSGISHG